MAGKQIVLVATDLSEPADEAVRQAHEWAASTGAELVACFVIPQTIREQSDFPPAYADDAVALLELERRAEDLVAKRISALTQSDAGELGIVIEGGRADLGIVRIADELEASIIVVGNRRSSEIDRLLLGSVSERIVRYASSSVLVARSHRRTGKMLAATDLSEAAFPAFTAATEVAARRNATLTVVHCIEAPAGSGASESISEMSRDLRQRRATVAGRLKELARVGPQVDVDILEGNPAEAIVAKANQLDAELVVVGTRGRTGLARLAYGSVAETVAREANCSVLAVRLGGVDGRLKVEE